MKISDVESIRWRYAHPDVVDPRNTKTDVADDLGPMEDSMFGTMEMDMEMQEMGVEIPEDKTGKAER